MAKWAEEVTAREMAQKHHWLASWDIRTMSDSGVRRYALALAAVSVVGNLMRVPVSGGGLRWTRILYMVTFPGLSTLGMVGMIRWGDRVRRRTLENPAWAQEQMAQRQRRWAEKYPIAAAGLEARWRSTEPSP